MVRLLLFTLALIAPGFLRASDPIPQIPDVLKPWQDWATWDDPDRLAPTPYGDATRHLTSWPSTLNLKVDHAGGQFDLTLTVFHAAWIKLPGDHDLWPLEVKANGVPVAVVGRGEGAMPSVKLTAGVYHLTGSYRWDEMPQRIVIPQEIGVLALTVEGKPVDAATWDAEGFLWLKRDRAEATDKDFLGIKIYRMIEDGIPMWLHTQVELSVAGKSREEDLRSVLPDGWQLAAVDSPIPVAIDAKGHLKAQVRAGKWVIKFDAFHMTPATQFGFSADAAPLLKEELVAFKAAPDFRMVEVQDVPSIDVSQTTFPQEWGGLPVYHWETATPFHLVERMRGMGLQKPEGLTIARELWMDENGQGLIFRDHLSGHMQQVWRLDAAENQDLGSVRSAGQGQLITKNPGNGAPGVEIRSRDLDLEATGRMNHSTGFSATGWRSDADKLSATLNLPPGWRLFALFGADWVQGDWLTAWTLLDLFLLLIFSLAVYRLWGIGPGVLAFVAFGLAYHEPGAPRYLWLLLLIPLGLLKVVRTGKPHKALIVFKYILVAALVIDLVPFVTGQVQEVLYPQLESTDRAYDSFLGGMMVKKSIISDMTMSGSSRSLVLADAALPANSPAPENSNLAWDTKARIQTGPGVPEWSWRTITFGWNGPVSATQKIHPILIPLWLHRILTILRVALLIALLWALVDGALIRMAFAKGPRAKALIGMFLAVLLSSSAQAQPIPSKETLEMLHDRLTQTSDAYPNAADIPTVSLSLRDRRVSMDAEIDAVIQVAVPLPGRLPAWSPVSVLVDGKPDAALRREGDYLWVVVPAGVHKVHLEALLPDVIEWEWTFQLKPHHVVIDAPGWSFSGVRADGIPEQQVFFTLKQKSTGTEASYDRQELHAIAAVDRHLEMGLIWQVHNEISRLSPAGRAISIRVPLLPGEKVLSSNVVPVDGFLDARLGANEKSFTWDSELTPTDRLALATKPDDAWVERWYLVASPVWNIAITGLAPVFEANATNLIPVWHPWPGEKVDLTISRPEAISGATVTVHNAKHTVSVGSRQRTSQLDLQLQCSLGEDFAITMPPQADVTSLTQNGNAIPVRKDGDKLIVSLQPGEQSVSIQWKTNTALGLYASADEVVLPVESANITTQVTMPDNCWILWAHGPLRGPAVQFWVILICAFIGAQILARVELSPLTVAEWTLLGLGLTQVDLGGFVIVAWLFLLAWRGTDSYQKQGPALYNLSQFFILGMTGASLLLFLNILGAGFLGRPEMFIDGNGSTAYMLIWYQAHADSALPVPGCVSVSIWWYRLLMLAWALWLASSLIRWLTWGWAQYSTGGLMHKRTNKIVVPPPFPKKDGRE